MPLFKQYIYPDHQLGIWKVEESLDELLDLLPDKGEMYLEEINSFSSNHRKVEYTAVRVLLFNLLKEEKTISYHSGEKPYLPDGSFHISISHTKGYVAVIISPEYEVGIDIEKYGDKVNKVAHKYIRPDEDNYDNPEEITVKRLLLWCAKETMFKCIGQSGVDFREHLKVEPFPLDQCYMNAFEYRTEQKKRFLIPYIIQNDFIMAWTVSK